MMVTNPKDLDYLVSRERQSRQMAAEPGDVAVKRAHLSLANGYAARISAINIKAGQAIFVASPEGQRGLR